MIYTHTFLVLCFLGLYYNSSQIRVVYIPILFSCSLGQSYNCIRASDVTVKEMVKIDRYKTTEKQ